MVSSSCFLFRHHAALFSCRKFCFALTDRLNQFLLCFVGKYPGLFDALRNLRIFGLDIFKQCFFKLQNFFCRNIQQMFSGSRIQDDNLIFYRNRCILRLFEDFTDTLALCQLFFGIGIQFGTKLCKGCQLTELCQLYSDWGSNLFIALI